LNGLRDLFTAQFGGETQRAVDPRGNARGEYVIGVHDDSLIEVWQIFAGADVKVTVDPRSDAQYALASEIFAWQAATDRGPRPGVGKDLKTAYGDYCTL